MTDTFVAPRQPSDSGTTGTATSRRLNSKFGDGYQQDAADGVNPIDRTQTLVWNPATPTEVDTMIAFLEAHVGVPFWYQLPRDLAPRAWIWVTYERGYPNPNSDQLTVSLEERFIY